MTSTKISKIIALGFGSGLSPVAPGTVGSIAATLLWLILSTYLTVATVWLLITFFALGLWATACELTLTPDDQDPSYIVIDEWAGVMVPLLLVNRGSVYGAIAACILFRIFDIWKPFPVRNAEELPGTFGVMIDDIVAGVYAAISLYALQILIHPLM